MIRALVVAVGLLLASTAGAGGPLVLSTDGTPVGWDVRAPVPYRTDLGGLGTLTNAAAIGLVDGLFATWHLPTATIRFARGGTLPVDVGSANFGPYLGPYAGAVAPRGENVVVFDADGSIFDALFGVGTGVIGFAGPVFLSDGATTVPIGEPVPPGAHIVEAIAFLNGKWIDGVDNPSSGNGELPLARFDAVFVHEFGHFAGLDHTQIHGLLGPPESDSPGRTTPVETMFPFMVDETQASLGRDDAVAIAALYPTPGFLSSTGRITGRVLDADGQPVAGANVVARNVADDGDAVSAVSGIDPNQPGAYTLPGLVAGAAYTVEVQEVDTFHADGSRVGPFSPPLPLPGPPEGYNGPDESADPARDDPAARTPLIVAAGATRAGIDVVLDRQLFSVRNVRLEPGSQPNGFALGDFDRDGVLDFVATQFGFTPGNVTRFYRGLGGGAFAPPAMIASFAGNAAVIAGQFNAAVDDFLDIAVASATLKAVRVYFGDGAGHFSAPVTVMDAPNDGPFLPGLAAGDLNGDPFPDLAAVAEGADGSAVAWALLGAGTGAFTIVTTPLPAGSGFPRGGLAMAQIAGSPAGDLIGIASGGGSSGPPALGVLVGDGTGHFQAAPVGLGAFTNAIGQRALALGDLDGDGRLDVALSDFFPRGGPNNWTRSFIDLLRGDGAGGFALAARYAVPETAQDGIVIADFDGDAQADVASAGAFFGPGSPGAKITVAFGDGAAGVRGTTSVWGLAEFPTRLVAADLDGDGRTDLLVDDGESSAFGLAPAPAYSVLLQAAGGPPPTSPPTTATTTSSTRTTTTSSSSATSTSSSTTSSSTTTTSTTSAPVPPPPLAPSADTYIEAGSQAALDHGAAAQLDSDASPAQVAYLSFDLRAVSAPVGRALLTLRCTNASAAGGTLYPVADATWIEGTRTGASGPGLTWNQVDTNRDGTLDGRDTSPWLPDFARPIATIAKVAVGQTVVVDVTAAFQGGARLYTLALRSTNTDGVAYASREAAAGTRPELRVELAGGPTTTSTSTTRTTSTSTSTTSTTVPPPAPGVVADTYIEPGSQAALDHGAAKSLEVDQSPARITYLKLDLRAVTAPVTRALLTFTCTSSSKDGGTLYPVADATWVEGTKSGSAGTGLTWNQVDTNRDGKLDARDTSPWLPDFARPVAALGAVSSGKTITVDVTASLQSGPGMYAFALRNGDSDGASYGSREASASQRPKLVLTLGTP